MKRLKLPPTNSFKISSKIVIGILLVINILVLWGWLNNKLYLTSIGINDFPMAPLTAVFFILISLQLLADGTHVHQRKNILVGMAVLLFLGSVSGLIMVFRLINYQPDFENLYLKISEVKNGASLGHMSFVTAFFFLCVSLILFLSKSSNSVAKNLGVILLIFLFSCNFILLEGYAFDAPFFFRLGYIPPASLTVFCFILVCCVIFLNYDRSTYIIEDIYRDSTRAKLLRLFIPFTLFITFIESVAIYRLIPMAKVHPAISISALLLLLFIGVLVAIPAMASLFGKSLDKAIEDLQKSEEDFRAIFELNSSAIVILNQENRIELTNNAYCQITGYKKDEMKGQLFLPSLEQSLDTLYQTNQSAELTHLSSYNFEIVCKNGEKRQCLLSKNSKQSSKYIICSFIDITEKKLAEDQLKISEQKLKDTLLTKDKLISIIGHDLRNPLANILALAEILEDFQNEKEYEQARDCTSKIKSSANQTLKLLNNLLEWTKLKAGQVSFDPKKCVLTPILEEALEQAKLQAGLKNIHLVFNKSILIDIVLDKKMLETILRNLLSNAIKFTPNAGQVELDITQNKNETVFSIKDSGVGIDKAKLAALFNPNSMDSTLGTNREKGTGLGLLLCKEFVEKHHGKIWVQSTLGKGSVFSFSIPHA